MLERVQEYGFITILHSHYLSDYFLYISQYLANIFEPERVIIYIFILCSLLYFCKKKYFAKFIFMNFLLTLSIVLVLKFLIDKSRSPIIVITENSSAFPSGHVAIAVTISILLFYYSKFVINSYCRISIIIFAFLFPFIMSFSRIYLYAHDIYDCVASFFISCLVFLILYNNRKKISRFDIKFLDIFFNYLYKTLKSKNIF